MGITITFITVCKYTDWVTYISSIPTSHGLYSKYTGTTINWYIGTSDSSTVGGNGAAATV